MSGLLSIVSTPIGNLEDITYRAVRTLHEADLILAEDTRQTRKLLSRYEIETRCSAFHAHSDDARYEEVLGWLGEGRRLALVSDAGCPVVSDPGGGLVARARENGAQIEVIPGPSAVTAAIALSGVRADHFRFVGFLPRKGGERRSALEALAQDASAQVLFESPKRVDKTLRDLEPLIGDRRIALCRELTKLHEEAVVGNAQSLLAHPFQRRGEFTIVLEASGELREAKEALDPESLARELLRSATGGLSQLSRQLSKDTELTRKEAYALLERVREEE